MVRLHCFAQSGNAFKVAFMLRALDVPFETVHVDFLNGITADPAWREDHNEMGEAPILEDGPVRLTQSGAILTYLAKKHERFGGSTESEQLEVLRWLLFDNHKFTSYFATYRFMKALAKTPPDPVVMKFLLGRIEGAFKVVDKHLATREYIVGDSPTIADFSMSGYHFFPQEESGIDVAGRWPHIGAWVERLKAIPGWASPYEVMPGEQLAPRW
ncbi:glutathione S-transferase family protein [Pseudoduganella umbonata]|uniref:Glutathione S-transferase n=1 Tax=Pseudoduganella umbonata TaxID=864828 RepID=A0A4P8HTF1_9BURK|nr:glutathione S-transferase [Pseudoduganella umbonata]MBB3225390.1 glutathione S-transferase [Pseudoduganella umbonata]QCP13219.1 glutathione S-transferase [Pseudoduganella umbonata]